MTFKKDLENECVLIEEVPMQENKRDMVNVVMQRDSLQAEVDRLNGIIAEAEKLGVSLVKPEPVKEEVLEPVVEVIE